MIVEINNLIHKFGSHTAVDGLNLQVPQGKFFGLLGPNGSGKTTVLRILSTLLRPTSGRATIDGCDVIRQSVEVRKKIGIVFQEPTLDSRLSVEDNLELAGAIQNLPRSLVRERSMSLLSQLDLAGIGKRKVRELSGGMIRAVDLTRGVLHRPKILLLDEPTSGLDISNRTFLLNYIKRLQDTEGTTLILTTHYLEEALPCNHVVFMKKGKVIEQGAPLDLIKTLGYYVLEVSGKDSQKISRDFEGRIGQILDLGRKFQFVVTDKNFSLSEVQTTQYSNIDSIQLRRPNLNDVYLWLNTKHDSSSSNDLKV